MAEIVTSTEMFELLWSRSQRLFRSGVSLPDYVFRDRYEVHRACDSGWVRADAFYDLMLDFSRDLSVDKLVFLMVDPNPSEYYFHHFRRYGAIVFDANDTGADVIHLLAESPPKSPADAMTHIVDEFAVFPLAPEVADWCVWAERACETAIVALKDRKEEQRFVELDKKWSVGIREEPLDGMTLSPSEAVDDFMTLPYTWSGDVVPEGFRKPFLENYKGT